MGELIGRQKRAFVSAALVLVSVVIILTGAASRSGAQSSAAEVNAGTYTIPNPDGTVKASIKIDPQGLNVGAIKVVVTYDKALVKPLSCENVAGVGACNFSVPGQISFDAVRGAQGWTSVFNATAIEFQALGKVGTSTLGVTVPEAYDSNLATLATRGVSGSITITDKAASATLTKSCLQENGMFKVNYNNPTGAAVTFRTSVTGLAARSKSVAANSVGLETITGRPDGDYTITVTANGTQILKSDETVSCDPPPQEVRVKTSCLASDGRIDVYLTNTNASAQTYSVAVGSLSPRTANLAAGATTRVTITGRADGSYPVVVKRGSTTVSNTTVEVDCDVDREVTIAKSCLQENGRIDTTLMNVTSAQHTYAVKVGNLLPRTRALAKGESVTLTVTGRPDGTIPVLVTRDGTQVASQSVAVSCDAVPRPDKPVSVSVSCLAGSGRIDVTLGNTGATAATYQVNVGDLSPRYRSLASNATDRVTVTGRPNGPVNVVVRRGGTQIFTSTETVSCR